MANKIIKDQRPKTKDQRPKTKDQRPKTKDQRLSKTLLFLFLFAALIGAEAGWAAEEAYTKNDSIVVKKYGGGKISFRLKDADLRSVLQLFSKQLGMNIIAGEDIKGNVTLSFTKVSPLEGLDAVLRVMGYEWSREGDTLIVTSQKTVRTFTLQFANAEEVQDSIKLLLGSDDTVSVNKSYNQIAVKASSSRIGSIARAISEIDIPQTQVMVEANIVEVKRNDDGSVGVNLSGISTSNKFIKTLGFADKAPSSGGSGLYAQVIGTNYEAYLSTYLTGVDYSILASPRITTINHKEASILIGEKVGYKTTVTTTTGTSTDIKFLETGTKLVLTPHVSSNGYIRMLIEPKVSEGRISDGVPNETTTETKNEVLVRDEQTIVIGGLFKKKELQTETGIPILMNLPFLGMLFKKVSITNENRELVIFIKPKIITPEYLKTMQGDVKKFLDKQKRQESTLIH